MKVKNQAIQGEGQMYCNYIEEIELPTEKLVACDPFILSEREPFNKTVKL